MANLLCRIADTSVNKSDFEIRAAVCFPALFLFVSKFLFFAHAEGGNEGGGDMNCGEDIYHNVFNNDNGFTSSNKKANHM